MNEKDYRLVTSCRSCGSKDLVPYLDLGVTPLANGMIKPQDIDKDELRFPLIVCYCRECSLSQLNVVVNPEILFKNYLYMSSISDTFRNHCHKVALDLVKLLALKKDDLVVDIASNDGCLLQEFKKENVRTLGVEPAVNLAKIANSAGIETLNSFWNIETAITIKEKYGGAKVITAFNVLAHVDNVHDFVNNVKMALCEDGLFVIQVPHLIDFLEKHEFDTVYHEHLSYFLLRPLQQILEKNGMKIIGVEKYDIHGGTIEVRAAKDSSKFNPSSKVTYFVTMEKNLGMYTEERYLNFAKEVKNMKTNLVKLIKELQSKNKRIAGFAASAKGNTLLNYCGFDSNSIEYVVDQTPTKQGLLTPGSHIPIVSMTQFENDKPDYLLILAWNFVDEIMLKTKRFKDKGAKYIIPIPKIQII
jgi:novobiocin biosynthesis protein NovU/D-mycarose 3-C-methyltransferase